LISFKISQKRPTNPYGVYMNEKILAKEELIGRRLRIKECTDPNWIGRSGTIIDETKNTFLLRLNNKHKTIAKNIATFEFEYDKHKINLNGKEIIYRTEDRIKKTR
jgi:RNase P/RNase MRP subunit p29